MAIVGLCEVSQHTPRTVIGVVLPAVAVLRHMAVVSVTVLIVDVFTVGSIGTTVSLTRRTRFPKWYSYIDGPVRTSLIAMP